MTSRQPRQIHDLALESRDLLMTGARGLIRGTLDKGTDSNAFKFCLADPDYGDDLALYMRGEVVLDGAGRHRY